MRWCLFHITQTGHPTFVSLGDCTDKYMKSYIKITVLVSFHINTFSYLLSERKQTHVYQYIGLVHSV